MNEEYDFAKEIAAIPEELLEEGRKLVEVAKSRLSEGEVRDTTVPETEEFLGQSYQVALRYAAERPQRQAFQYPEWNLLIFIADMSVAMQPVQGLPIDFPISQGDKDRGLLVSVIQTHKNGSPINKQDFELPRDPQRFVRQSPWVFRLRNTHPLSFNLLTNAITHAQQIPLETFYASERQLEQRRQR